MILVCFIIFNMTLRDLSFIVGWLTTQKSDVKYIVKKDPIIFL